MAAAVIAGPGHVVTRARIELREALRAASYERELSEARLVSEALAGMPVHGFKLVGVQCGERVAALAIEELERFAADEDVASRSAAEMDLADDPEVLEHLQIAIHRRLVDAQATFELDRG